MSGTATRVLVVDDNRENRYLLRALLEGNGFLVDDAANGEEGLARARANPPDIVVSDLLMPVMDGYALLREWHRDAALRGTPFLVYTATFTEPRDERLAMALGATGFLVKPSEPDVLLARVREALAAPRPASDPRADVRPLAEDELLREYNEVLVAKLEHKARELEAANRDLRAEIAERRRSEAEELRTSQLLRAVVEGTSDAIYVKSAEGIYLLYNQAAAQAVGRSVHDVVGHDDVELFGEEGARVVRANDEAVIRSGRALTLDEPLLVGGEVRTFLTHKAPFRDANGKVAGLIGISRDITERKRSEEALRLRDRAIQQLAQGVLITQHTVPGQPIIYASAGFERMTGYRSEEILGRNCRFLQGKDTDPAAVAAMRDAIAAQRPVVVELLNYRKDGTPFWNELSLNPVCSDSGVLEFYVGVQTDVTARRQLEEQLRQSQKMEAVGRLAGGIAHDFNNLLTVIGGYSEQLLLEGGLSEDDEQSVKAINDAGKRAGQLTRQLLSFSRQAILQPRVVEVNTHVARTAQMLRRLIAEDVEFTTVFDQHCGSVRVDPGQLDQVLMNLAVNARDAMPRGGLLTIETRPVSLTAADTAGRLDCPPGDYVVLAVKDTGTGMPPEVLEHVFEPFFTTKEPGKGTGLGLSMVFGIVKQSGGAVDVESAVGRGTTFSIYLPAVVEPQPVTEPVSFSRLTGTETILVVEDDADVRALTVRSLERQGYTLLVARSGTEAIDLANAHTGTIHLLLSDVVMPVMGGPVLAEALKHFRPGLKVLFMSGYTDDAVVRHGLLDATVDFIQKPYSTLALAKKVREVLDGVVATE